MSARVSPGRVVAAVSCCVLAVGCTGQGETIDGRPSMTSTTVTAGDAQPQSPATTPAPGPHPTHTHTALPDSASTGRLGGTVSCLSFGSGEGRRALLLPAGMTTEQVGDEVVVLDASGRERARTGDRVIVGGIDGDTLGAEQEPCDDAPDRAPFLASSVQRCTPGECGDD